MPEYTIIDVETTDFSPQAQVCQVAWLYHPEAIAQVSYIHPTRRILPEAMAVHHIRNEDVHAAPSWDEVLSDIFMCPQPFVAHSASFDSAFFPPARWLCTRKLACAAHPRMESHALQFLRYALNLNPSVPEGTYPHHALYDVYVCDALFSHLAPLWKWDFEEMFRVSNSPMLLHTVSFGKHKGMTWKEVAATDPSYLSWLLRQGWPDEDVRNTVEAALQGVFAE